MKEKSSFIPKKSLGQNFLVDKNAREKILDIISFQKDGVVVEIGPGAGALSFMVLPLVSEYFAVELDDMLYRQMRDDVPSTLKNNIFHHDAAKFSFEKLYSEKKLVVFGNLPYSCATPILIHLCKFTHIIEKIVVMVQKEVGDRICSPPGIKDYGALSITMQNSFVCEVHAVFPPACFRPRPKVDSCIISLFPKREMVVPQQDCKGFFVMVKKLFSGRRKTLRKNLKKSLLPGISESDQEKVFALSNVLGTVRAETLSIEELYRFYLALEDVKA